jgi:glycolate oxidase FAD binding subunit
MTMPAALRDEADVAEAVRSARGPLRIRGGGTRGGAGAGMAVLGTAGLAGITLYEPGALTLVVRAGTPLAEVERVLAAEGQRLAFEPPDLRALCGCEGVSTIGGVVAANASGPRRVQAGACRDFLLGVRFVDGTGAVVKNGGRVMKNVTGYDLARLMAGSRGMLGVLTEVALKVLPAPGAAATVVLEGLDMAGAVAAMARGLATPWEVTGAAHWPGRGTFLRIEGFAEQVAYRGARLAGMLGGRVEPGPGPWAAIRDAAPLAGWPGDVWRLHCKATEAPGLVARTAAGAVLMDWGGALVWLGVAPGLDLRARLGAFAGHATRVRGEGAAPALPPEPPAVAALSAGLRARFDPRGVFAG